MLRGQRVVRVRETSGSEVSAMNMKPEQVRQALAAGASAIVLEVPEREVPKVEKQKLLLPQEMFLGDIKDKISGVFASAECTFIAVEGSAPFGCGLNGDGQIGLGFISMVVPILRRIQSLSAGGASWLGGGLHNSAALGSGKVWTWGKAEECGHGLGQDTAPILVPRVLAGLPDIRTVRCGGHHTLACSEVGDVFVWGCGLTYQLANRPRDSANPVDVDEDPEDELRPYCISSKQLDKRFVLAADGGAQHSVELAWTGHYGPSVKQNSVYATPSFRAGDPAPQPLVGSREAFEDERLAKRPKGLFVDTDIASQFGGGNSHVVMWDATAVAEVRPSFGLTEEHSAQAVRQSVAAVATGKEVAAVAAARRLAREEARARADSGLIAKAEAEILSFFSGSLLSEPFGNRALVPAPPEQQRVLWSPRTCGVPEALERAAGQRALGPIVWPLDPAAIRLQAQLACLDRGSLETLLLESASGLHAGEGGLCAAVRKYSSQDRGAAAASASSS